MERTKERDKKMSVPSKQVPSTKPAPSRDRSKPSENVRSSGSSSTGLAPPKVTAKDPLKVSGQKQSIKLTLSNKERVSTFFCSHFAVSDGVHINDPLALFASFVFSYRCAEKTSH